MDLSHPITMVDSPLTGRVLEVLAGTTRPMSGSQVHRLAGVGSRAGVWKVLGRLVEQGLVDAEAYGNATHYTANREHLAWPAVEQLALLRQAMLDRLRTAIDEWNIAPLHASLFGSGARGDGDTASDLDLLLVRADLDGRGLEAWDTQVDELRGWFERMTGNPVRAMVLDAARLRAHISAGDPIVGAWLEDGILLAGRPLRELAGDR